MKNFFRTWYVPNNATLVVAGDFEPAVAKKLIQEQFGAIPASTPPEPQPSQPVTLDETVRIVQHEDVPAARVWVGWHSPEFFAKGDAELDLWSTILCSGADTRLEQAIVREKGLARELSCYQVSRDLGSTFIVSAAAADGHTTDEVVDAVEAEIAAILDSKPPTEAELEAARAQFEVGYWETLETIQGRATLVSTYLYHHNSPDFLAKDLARYNATVSDLLATGKDVFTKPHVELHILPTSGEDKEAN